MSAAASATQPSDALCFFGATGDLAYKQIFPALQSMIRHGKLDVPIVGIARAGWGLDDLKRRARDSVTEHGGLDPDAFAKLEQQLRYVDGDYEDPATFVRLCDEMGDAQCPLHYLAIPPTMFATVVEALHRCGAARGARVVVEKPFGRDLASAQALNRTLATVFPESAIFRIDHYLGKEPVENILYSRFANGLFEPLFNRENIRSIQITMAEDFGVAGRGKFYDEAGAIRDVVQNHMLQVLALMTMDAPVPHAEDAIRDAKARVFHSIATLKPENVVRGQFEGYLDEPGVAAGSTVETFAAVRLSIDSWRWAGVPVLIRAGKQLPCTGTEVIVELRRAPQQVFDAEPTTAPNTLRFTLSPHVELALTARVKKAGEKMVGERIELVSHRREADDMPPYERLLGDAMRGDPGLFAREDSVEAAWRIVEPILDDATPLYTYRPGTWGPSEADRLLPRAMHWHAPTQT